jgi:hypothetical protein
MPSDHVLFALCRRVCSDGAEGGRDGTREREREQAWGQLPTFSTPCKQHPQVARWIDIDKLDFGRDRGARIAQW